MTSDNLIIVGLIVDSCTPILLFSVSPFAVHVYSLKVRD